MQREAKEHSHVSQGRRDFADSADCRRQQEASSGLDSLAIAILVARLEETLGFDPFTESNDVAYPVTLGDFIRFYEHAAASHGVDSR